MHVLVKNNYAGDVVDVHVLHNIENTLGIYLKIEGVIETNSYKYNHLTCPHFFTATENTQNLKDNLNFNFYSKFYVKLPEKLLPCFKSLNFSVSYSLQITTLQAKKKRIFKCPLEIINSNFDCESESEIQDFSNSEYLEKKKVALQLLNKTFDNKNQLPVEEEINEENFLLSESETEVFLVKGHRIKKVNEKSVDLEKPKEIFEFVDFNIDQVTDLNISTCLLKLDLIKNIPVFRNPRIYQLNDQQKEVKIQGETENSFLAFIYLPQVFLSTGDIRICYKQEISNTTLTILQQDYEKDQLVDVKIIQTEFFNSKNCLEKIFTVEFNDFSIKCDRFAIKYVIILA